MGVSRGVRCCGIHVTLVAYNTLTFDFCGLVMLVFFFLVCYYRVVKSSVVWLISCSLRDSRLPESCTPIAHPKESVGSSDKTSVLLSCFVLQFLLFLLHAGTQIIQDCCLISQTENLHMYPQRLITRK